MINSSASRFPANLPDDPLRTYYDAMHSALISAKISPGVVMQPEREAGCVDCRAAA